MTTFNLNKCETEACANQSIDQERGEMVRAKRILKSIGRKRKAKIECPHRKKQNDQRLNGITEKQKKILKTTKVKVTEMRKSKAKIERPQMKNTKILEDWKGYLGRSDGKGLPKAKIECLHSRQTKQNSQTDDCDSESWMKYWKTAWITGKKETEKREQKLQPSKD